MLYDHAASRQFYIEIDGVDLESPTPTESRFPHMARICYEKDSKRITTDCILSLRRMCTRVQNAVDALLSIRRHHRATTMSVAATNNRVFTAEKVFQTASFSELRHQSFDSAENRVIANHKNAPISVDRKTVNIAELIDEKLRKEEPFFSLELFLSKKYKSDVYKRFISEVSRNSLTPLFYATTWHASPSSDKSSNYPPLEIYQSFPNNTLLHVAANNSTEDEVRKILDNALTHGKTNIFALRGDSWTGNGDFRHAVDLVRFVRANYGKKFVVCVAGFPHMHPESVSKETDLMYLKEKVEAGADFIISQIFLESEVFIQFVEDCRKSGIKVPIVPGIFPIVSYKSLTKIARLCSFEIPQKVLQDIELLKDDDQAVYDYGIELARTMIKDIFARRAANGFHLFTLNRVSVGLDVCKKILDR